MNPTPNTDPAPRPAPPSEQALREQAMRVIALHGGLTPQAARHIAWIVRAGGRDPAAFMARMGGMRQPTFNPAPPAPTSTQAPPPAPAATPERRRSDADIIAGASPEPWELPPTADDRGASGWPIIIALAIVGLSLALVVIVAAWPSASTAPTPPDPTRAASASPPPPDAEATPPPPDAAQAPTPVPPPREDPLAQLRAAVEQLRIDPQAAGATFAKAIDALAPAWPELDPARRRAADAALVEFVYRASPWPEVARDAVDHISGALAPLRASSASPTDADAITAAVWASGTLARLARQRDLPASALRPAAAALAETLGDTAAITGGDDDAFHAGAVAAMLAIAPTLAATKPDDTTEDAWARYIDLVPAAAISEATRQEILVRALNAAARLGPSPFGSDAAASIIERLVAALDWSDAAPARAWLIDAFADQSVSSETLWGVTSALVSSGAAPEADISMTLPLAATPPGRIALRDRYRAVWGMLDTGPTDGLITDWADAARAALRAHAGDDSAERLAYVARLAWTAAAAEHLFEGRFQDAAERLNRAESSAWFPRADRAAGSELDRSGDGAWALEYLSAGRRIDERLRLIGRLRTQRSLGRIDAEVLVAEAVSGSPREVRRSAWDMAARFETSPAVVHALLEELPLMPATRANAELIARVTATPRTSVRRAEWRREARRELVTRLLDMLTRRGDWADIDMLSAELARAYASDASADKDAPAAPSIVRAPEDIARERTDAWIARARRVVQHPSAPITAESLLRERASRRLLARGPVQMFHVEQVAQVQAMAVALGAERDAARAEIAAALAEMDRARAEAVDITEQLVASERARVALWLTLFGREDAR